MSPTSNIVERLFSNAKLIMTALRKKMDPDTFNMILFLKPNRELWPNAGIIQKIINDLKEKNLDVANEVGEKVADDENDDDDDDDEY